MSDWSDFGGLLRSTRESQEMSIEDIANRTRIPAATLRQMEANDYSQFASRAYAKSFLSQYAEFLDIDAVEWLDEFEVGDTLADLDSYGYLRGSSEKLDFGGSEPAPKTKTPKPRLKKEAKPATPKASKPKEEKPTEPRLQGAALQPVMVFTVTALLITAGVFGFMRLSEKLSATEQQVTNNQPAIEEEEENLKPVAGIPTNRPLRTFEEEIPRALPVTSEDALVVVEPGTTTGVETLIATPTTQGDAPIPRAVIVEE